jgi:hypothetical protein
VKTIHSAGCGGKSDLFQLNGPEIRKWIKKDCTTALRTGAEKKETSPPDQKSTYTTLKRWLENLHQFLLIRMIGNRRKSKIGVQQSMIYNRIGQMRPIKLHSRSYTCFYTRWNSLNVGDSLVEHQRHRSSPIITHSRDIQPTTSQQCTQRTPAHLPYSSRHHPSRRATNPASEILNSFKSFNSTAKQ